MDSQYQFFHDHGMADIGSSNAPTPGGGPAAATWPFWARFAQLLAGLVLFGGSVSLLVSALPVRKPAASPAHRHGNRATKGHSTSPPASTRQ